MGIILDARKEKYKHVWLEKWRPSELDEIALDERYERKFREFINNKDIPSLLFIGPPGTGKTTMAYILLDKLIEDDMDFLEINGSLFRGINVVREMLMDFVKSETMFAKKKIIFIDEADKLTPDAQDSLRNVIEQNADHVSFIFTANYKYKITDALMSRLQTYTFKVLPKDVVSQTLFKILDNEKIVYNKSDVQYIIDSTYPDMRRALNEINKVVYLNNDKTRTLELSAADVDFLIEQKYTEKILTLLNTPPNDASFTKLIQECYELIYRDTMDYLHAFEKLNLNFRNIKLKTLSAKFYNEVGKCISPKFLMLEFFGEFLNIKLKQSR